LAVMVVAAAGSASHRQKTVTIAQKLLNLVLTWSS